MNQYVMYNRINGGININHQNNENMSAINRNENNQ
jgi:hypothetical protein